MAKIKMDDRGRISIPIEEREKLGLRAGTEFELIEQKRVLLLKPIVSAPVTVQSRKSNWGKDGFLGSGEATFGE